MGAGKELQLAVSATYLGSCFVSMHAACSLLQDTLDVVSVTIFFPAILSCLFSCFSALKNRLCRMMWTDSHLSSAAPEQDWLRAR